MGRLVEGMWTCPSCKTVNISGSKRECPTCGKPRDLNTTFYIDIKKINYVSDKDTKKLQNPDWTCYYCKSLNSANVTSCSSCGSERTETSTNYFQNQQVKQAEKQRIAQENAVFTENKSVQPKQNYYTNTQPVVTKTKINRKSFKKPVIFSVFVLFIFLIAFFASPKEKTFTVQNMAWDKVVHIEEYKTVQESDWSLSEAGRLTLQQNEIYEYKKVLDHYETRNKEVAETVQDGYDTNTQYIDKGNGYFEEKTTQTPRYKTVYHTETYEEPVYREDPIYKTKYYYDIERWVETRQVHSEGTKDIDFEIPIFKENERESSRDEKYFIHTINKKNKEVSYALSFDDWNNISIGQKLKAKVSALNEIVSFKIVQ